jgi:DNA mismatch endonuclease, patch repair protein
MVDTLGPAQRSERMSRIRGRDTAPELALRRALHHRGLRYRLYGAQLPGRPDIVFPSRRAVVFVHGCFWHRHDGCRIATTPKSNTSFWQAKFDRNVERDLRNGERLRELGWIVIVVWECELSTTAKAAAAAGKVHQLLPPPAGAGREH